MKLVILFGEENTQYISWFYGGSEIFPNNLVFIFIKATNIYIHVIHISTYAFKYLNTMECNFAKAVGVVIEMPICLTAVWYIWDSDMRIWILFYMYYTGLFTYYADLSNLNLWCDNATLVK